jgi:hypothetical protein
MARQARVRGFVSVLAAVALAAWAFAPALADDRASRLEVRVGACEDATKQLCTPAAPIAIDVETGAVLLVEFVPSAGGCAPLIGHLLLDGLERFKSPPLDPGQSSGLQDLGDVVAGQHVVGVQAEGVPEGCNTGKLGAWSGTVTIVLSSTLFSSPAPSFSATPLPTPSATPLPLPTLTPTFAPSPTLPPIATAAPTPIATAAASPAPAATTPPTTLFTPFGPVELTSRNLLIALLAVLGVVFVGLVLFVLRRR